MTVIATWIDEPWRLPTTEGETDMGDFKHCDIDGDRIEVQHREDHDSDTRFWAAVIPCSGRDTAAWLSKNAARELRDWLTEQLGDAVEAEPVAAPTEARITALQTARRITGSSNAETLIDLAEWILGDEA